MRVQKGAVGGALREGERRLRGHHVLVEAELSPGLQHAPDLGECRRLVGHRAERPAGHGGVERLVLGGEGVGQPLHHLDLDGRLLRGLRRLLAHVALRLDGQHVRHGLRVEAEPDAAAGPDVHDPAGYPVEQLAPLLVATLAQLERGHLRLEAGEERVVNGGGHRHGGR
jgi:hypothetical protein